MNWTDGNLGELEVVWGLKMSHHQWSFLVPLIDGRYHKIPQLAVYTTYIPLIYCQLGDYILPIPPIKGTRKLHWHHPRICIKQTKRLTATHQLGLHWKHLRRVINVCMFAPDFCWHLAWPLKFQNSFKFSWVVCHCFWQILCWHQHSLDAVGSLKTVDPLCGLKTTWTHQKSKHRFSIWP